MMLKSQHLSIQCFPISVKAYRLDNPVG